MKSRLDKRKQARLPLELQARLTLPSGAKLKCMTINLSFGGAFLAIESISEIHVNDHCGLTLFLDQAPDGISIRLTCRIAHISEEGAGVQFMAIDIEGYEHFKSLMISNSPEPGMLTEELRNNPGLLLMEGGEEQHGKAQ